MSQVATEQRTTTQPNATAWTRPPSDYIALLRAGAAQQPGAKARRENSLAVYMPQNDTHAAQGNLFVLAEGAGALPGSAIASKAVIEQTIRAYYASPSRQPGNKLVQAVALAGQHIYDMAQQQPLLQGMGSSAACAAIVGDKLWVAGSGDSRAYLLRPSSGTLELLTETPDAGRIRVLGSVRQAEAQHSGPHTIAAGDVLILCSNSMAADVESGAALRFMEATGGARAGSDGQGLADALINDASDSSESGAVIAVTCQAVVPLAAAQRAGWPRRYSCQLSLPLPSGAPSRHVERAEQPKPRRAEPESRMAIHIEEPDESAEQDEPLTVTPKWLADRPAATPKNYKLPQPVYNLPVQSLTPVAVSAVPVAAAPIPAGSKGAPQWLSHLVIVTAIAIISSTIGIVIGLGPQHWFTALGVAIAVLTVSFVLLWVLQYSRRARPLQTPAPAQPATSSYQIPRRVIEPTPAPVAPTKRTQSRTLNVSNPKMEYAPLDGGQRTPPTKVDILDAEGLVVGRLAIGAPDHLIDPASGRPTGFYVLLYDAVTCEERAMAWLAPGPQHGSPRPTNPDVLRDVTVAGEDPCLRANWLRGSATFTLCSSGVSAELELLFYHYNDPIRRNTLDNVQVGVKSVCRITSGQ